MVAQPRLRRSVLYMPGANARALEKAASLDADALIFDLEDAVAPASKGIARTNVVAALKRGNYAHREVVVRVNALDTPWGREDLQALAGLPVHAVLFPKVNSAAMVADAAAALEALVDATPVPNHKTNQGLANSPRLWAMIESPQSILELPQITSASDRLDVLVMGTSDLVRDLRARHVPSREPLIYALSAAVIAARARGLEVLDGVHLDFRNLETFRATCEQGRALGFDGRTLIHPSQVEIANNVFGFSTSDVEHARRVLDVWQQAEAEGRGVVELDGQLIENLHAADAQRLLELNTALLERGL